MTSPNPAGPRRVLVVCLGNICRSPTAEVILRAKLPHWQVDSAGTSDWHIGKPPYGPMVTAAKARGYDLSPLRARQVTASDFAVFDLILAMDGANLGDLTVLRPASGGADLALFLGEGDVPDPYYTRDFEGCIDLIQARADALAREFSPREKH